MEFKEAFEEFLNPPREFGPMPFWFWNDDLDEEELIRQLHAFRDAHYGGFVLHARVGLSRRIGYLTEEFFRLARRIVEEAARLDMKVILYDEGSYPSGSAQGSVVAENPEYASRAIGLWEKEFAGPYSGYWRPNTGRAILDRHVCTLLGRMHENGRIDSDSVQQLEALPNDIFRIDAPVGKWMVMSVWNTQSGGHIRGVYPEEESGSVIAPAAGDILNPDAVACFIRLTHDRYFEHLKEFFGTTVIAMFTDEPSVFGKSPLRPKDPRPFTPGLIEWLETRWGYDPRPWLPALWLNFGEGTEELRRKYERAIQERMHEVFYAAQSKWCADHGIALTGHPARSNEMSALRYFQLPGQDMVWRYVEPDKPSALEGEHSVAAKAATSGAQIRGSRRVLTEVLGAYGWKLTLEEVKWLFDWHLVRGNNLINPHAVFYSIRGRRAWESEPDLCLHNVWQPYVGLINRYAQRVSRILCDGTHVCEVAVLGDGDNLPWEAAAHLYRNQIDFLYLDDEAVADGWVRDGALETGSPLYSLRPRRSGTLFSRQLGKQGYPGKIGSQYCREDRMLEPADRRAATGSNAGFGRPPHGRPAPASEGKRCPDRGLEIRARSNGTSSIPRGTVNARSELGPAHAGGRGGVDPRARRLGTAIRVGAFFRNRGLPDRIHSTGRS